MPLDTAEISRMPPPSSPPVDLVRSIAQCAQWPGPERLASLRRHGFSFDGDAIAGRQYVDIHGLDGASACWMPAGVRRRGAACALAFVASDDLSVASTVANRVAFLARESQAHNRSQNGNQSNQNSGSWSRHLHIIATDRLTAFYVPHQLKNQLRRVLLGATGEHWSSDDDAQFLESAPMELFVRSKDSMPASVSRSPPSAREVGRLKALLHTFAQKYDPVWRRALRRVVRDALARDWPLGKGCLVRERIDASGVRWEISFLDVVVFEAASSAVEARIATESAKGGYVLRLDNRGGIDENSTSTGIEGLVVFTPDNTEAARTQMAQLLFRLLLAVDRAKQEV